MSEKPKSKSKLIQWFIDHVGKIEKLVGFGLVGVLFGGVFSGDVRNAIGYAFNKTYQELFDNSIHECDRLAADPDDQQRTSEGVPTSSLSQDALAICENANNLSENSRIKHQYARLLYKFGNNKQKYDAIEIYNGLTSADYVASFGRLGSILLKTGDVTHAIKVLQAGAEKGSSVAQYQLGIAYMRGYPGVLKPDYDRASSLVKKAAEQHNSDAIKLMENLDR